MATKQYYYSERIKKDNEASIKSINELLGSPVDISSIRADSGAISKVAFSLYQETCKIAIASSNLYESYNPKEGGLSRDQAISAGLIVRIAKFMMAVMALLCDKVREHGDVILALNRCITETAINLEFFCRKATQDDFDQFVKSSLKPEKGQYDFIQDSIQKRGSELAIETRMLNSIKRVFQNSGISDIEDLCPIPVRKNYRDILRSLGLEWAYSLLQGVPSHSIHGTWVDVVLHHLEKTAYGFRPKSDSIVPDARLLCPVGIIVLISARSYISKHFIQTRNVATIILNRIEDSIARNETLNTLHEQYLSNR